MQEVLAADWADLAGTVEAGERCATEPLRDERRVVVRDRIEVVYLEPVTLDWSRVRQRYELVGDELLETPVGAFDATRWRFTALDSGWSANLCVADDTVVRYERLFELAWLDPGRLRPAPGRLMRPERVRPDMRMAGARVAFGSAYRFASSERPFVASASAISA